MSAAPGPFTEWRHRESGEIVIVIGVVDVEPAGGQMVLYNRAGRLLVTSLEDWQAPLPTPVCKTCGDQHRVGSRVCTSCPLPCPQCRLGGIGAFCDKTPCACACHEGSFLYVDWRQRRELPAVPQYEKVGPDTLFLQARCPMPHEVNSRGAVVPLEGCEVCGGTNTLRHPILSRRPRVAGTKNKRRRYKMSGQDEVDHYAEVPRLNARVQELLESNNAYLERARLAEYRLSVSLATQRTLEARAYDLERRLAAYSSSSAADT
jgi:hypothetical protein